MNARTQEIFKHGIHPRDKPKSNLLVPVLVIIILIVAIGSIFFIFSSSKEKITGLQTADMSEQEMQTNTRQEIKPETISEPLPKTKEKPSVETSTHAKLGILEILVSNITEGAYTEWDSETLLKVNKTYYKIYVKLFNPTWDETDSIESITLTDDLDNEYLPSANPNKFVSLRELGKDWKIYSRISREGYLFFTDIDENIKKYDLIFTIRSEDDIKRAIYSFEMVK